jgi:hypothetical protein
MTMSEPTTTDTDEVTHTGAPAQCPCPTFVHAYSTARCVEFLVTTDDELGTMTCANPTYYDRPVWPAR